MMVRPLHPLQHYYCSTARRWWSSRTCSPRLSDPKPRRLGLRLFSKMARDEDDPEMVEFLDYMDRLRNYERLGVPTGAGTDSDDGFDLGRMRRLLRRLGDPHLKFKAVHIAGTKGKGSTAAFLSSILREEGYSVGSYTSPHLFTIRERISFGEHGDPVSASALKNILNQARDILDQCMEEEKGALTHFEILTALAFSLFSQEKVDIAIIEAGLGGARDATNVLISTNIDAAVITTIGEEHLAALGGSVESIAAAKAGIIKQGCPLVIGGPFDSQIEGILRQKASSMNAPIISACDPGIHIVKKGTGKQDDRTYQMCDILVNVRGDLPLFIKLSNVKLSMLGDHQLQNAVTSICTALCLRYQGWKISDESFLVGLEHTILPGRSQFLTTKEAEVIGLPGSSVLIEGAHTEASAQTLADMIRKSCQDGPVALVVAMAIDKDHLAFAKQLLSGLQPCVVLLTEVKIAGSRSRVTPAALLKDCWVHAAADLDVDFVDVGLLTDTGIPKNQLNFSTGDKRRMLLGCSMGSIRHSLQVASQLMKSRVENQPGLIVATGSLHIVSSILAAISM